MAIVRLLGLFGRCPTLVVSVCIHTIISSVRPHPWGRPDRRCAVKLAAAASSMPRQRSRRQDDELSKPGKRTGCDVCGVGGGHRSGNEKLRLQTRALAQEIAGSHCPSIALEKSGLPPFRLNSSPYACGVYRSGSCLTAAGSGSVETTYSVQL